MIRLILDEVIELGNKKALPEPCPEKTGIFPLRKQRRRSALQ